MGPPRQPPATASKHGRARGGPPGGAREAGRRRRPHRARKRHRRAGSRTRRSLTSRCAPAPPRPLGACVVQPARFHGSGNQQGGRRAQPLVPRLAAMSAPEVEALVSQKYEIKRRLGKGVSARGARGAGRRGAGPPGAGPPGAGPSRGPPGSAFVCSLPVPAQAPQPRLVLEV